MRKRGKKRSSKIDLKLNRIESNKNENENEKAHNRQKHVEHNNTTQKRDFDSQ